MSKGRSGSSFQKYLRNRGGGNCGVQEGKRPIITFLSPKKRDKEREEKRKSTPLLLRGRKEVWRRNE